MIRDERLALEKDIQMLAMNQITWPNLIMEPLHVIYLLLGRHVHFKKSFYNSINFVDA
jgi:hypothetical protein